MSLTVIPLIYLSDALVKSSESHHMGKGKGKGVKVVKKSAYFPKETESTKDGQKSTFGMSCIRSIKTAHCDILFKL